MIVVYDRETGRIKWVTNDPVPPGTTDVLKSENLPYVRIKASIDPAVIATSFYVDARKLVRRPKIDGADAQIAADGRDVVHYRFPAGARVSIDGEVYDLSDGDLEFSTDEPGIYIIEFDQWPHVPFTAKVTAR